MDRVAIIRAGHLVELDPVRAIEAKALRVVEIRFGSPIPAESFAGLPACARSVFAKTRWERRHGLLFWSLGAGVLVVAVLSAWPSVHDEYAKLVQNYPEALLALLGVDKAGLASPPRYLQAELFGLMVPLTFVGYADRDRLRLPSQARRNEAPSRSS